MNLAETAVAAGAVLPEGRTRRHRRPGARRAAAAGLADVFRPGAPGRLLGAARLDHAISAFDFRVGGSWKMVIRFPGGADVPMDSLFEEIVAPGASCSATCPRRRPARRCRMPTCA